MELACLMPKACTWIAAASRVAKPEGVRPMARYIIREELLAKAPGRRIDDTPFTPQPPTPLARFSKPLITPFFLLSLIA